MYQLRGISLLIVSLLILAGVAFAQEKALTGTWLLQSLTLEEEGKKSEPFGSAPQGTLMLDGHRLMYMVSKPDIPKMAANSRLKGTPEEYKAIAEGVLAFFGTYTVSGEELMVAFESSTFPNWNGTTQKRTYTLDGDKLTLSSTAAARGGAGVVHQIFTRAK